MKKHTILTTLTLCAMSLFLANCASKQGKDCQDGKKAAEAKTSDTTSEMTSEGTPDKDCEKHASHQHKHGKNCGHKTVKHDGHTDYKHDGHSHAEHNDHYDEHGKN